MAGRANVVALRRRGIDQEPPGAGFAPITVDPPEPSRPRVSRETPADAEPQQIPQPDGSVLIFNPAVHRSRAKGAVDFDENLAEHPDVPLSTIANEALEGFDEDQQSRREWLETAMKGKEYLGVDWTDAIMSSTEGAGNISRIKDSLLLEACLKSWANSRAELLPADGPVKVRDDLPADSDDMQAEIARAQAEGRKPRTRSQEAEDFEKDFNHYLTTIDTDYYNDTSQMLMARTGIGMGFKKVFRHPILRRPVSRAVQAENLVCSNDASTIEECSRTSEIIVMRHNLVRRMQKMGIWRDVALNISAPQFTQSRLNDAALTGVNITPTRSEDYPNTIIEQIVDLDDGILGEDENGEEVGWALPYVVTMDKDSREVLSIVRFWRKGDENYMRRRRYVKFGFVPGFGSGIYNWGYFHILGNPERAATAMGRMIIDAGMYASFPGGLISKGPGSRQQKMTLRAAPGEFIPIDTGGMPIGDVVSEYPYKEPSAVLAAALQQTQGDARRLAGVLEMPIGEGRVGDVPVPTIMAFLDSLSKVPSAVHKDDHKAQQTEFEMLRDLFIEDPSALSRFAKKPARKWATADEFEDQDLVPAADPNISSHVHRIMQASALVQMSQMPQFNGIANPRTIWQKAVVTLGMNADEVTLPPQAPQPPPPDPKIIAAQINAQSKQQQSQADLQKTQMNADAKEQTAQLDAQQREADRQSEEMREAMRLDIEKQKHTVDTTADLTKHAVGIASDHALQANDHALDHAHHVDDMNVAQQAAMQPPAPEGDDQT